MYFLKIRWMNGRVTKMNTDSLHSAMSIKNAKVAIHGLTLGWTIKTNNKIIKRGFE